MDLIVFNGCAEAVLIKFLEFGYDRLERFRVDLVDVSSFLLKD